MFTSLFLHAWKHGESSEIIELHGDYVERDEGDEGDEADDNNREFDDDSKFSLFTSECNLHKIKEGDDYMAVEASFEEEVRIRDSEYNIYEEEKIRRECDAKIIKKNIDDIITKLTTIPDIERSEHMEDLKLNIKLLADHNTEIEKLEGKLKNSTYTVIKYKSTIKLPLGQVVSLPNGEFYVLTAWHIPITELITVKTIE